MKKKGVKTNEGSFAGIIGQPVPVRVLSHLIDLDRLPGTLLFSGPGGVGKLATALQAAKNLHCREKKSPDCDCLACRAIRAGNHPDVMVLSRDRLFGVDEMREIVALAGLKSSDGQERVIIIDRVENITTAAANAALKVLEEPGDHVRFILITDTPSVLLPTVRSRSYHLRFGLVAADAMREFVRTIGDDPSDPDTEKALEFAFSRPGLYLRLKHCDTYRDVLERVSGWLHGTRGSISLETALRWKDEFWELAGELSDVENKSNLPRGGNALEIRRHYGDPGGYPLSPVNFRLEAASRRKAQFWTQGRKALLLAGVVRHMFSLEKTARNASAIEKIQDFSTKVSFNCSFDIALERLYFGLAGL